MQVGVLLPRVLVRHMAGRIIASCGTHLVLRIRKLLRVPVRGGGGPPGPPWRRSRQGAPLALLEELYECEVRPRGEHQGAVGVQAGGEEPGMACEKQSEKQRLSTKSNVVLVTWHDLRNISVDGRIMV